MSSAAATTARDIPTIKKAESGTPLPAHYSTTPSGTIYSSTPGGSRIIYDRTTLLNLANSPMAKTPPSNLVYVPGVTKVHTDNHHKSTKPNNYIISNINNKPTQVEGHLAPPQTLPFPGLQQQQQKKSNVADSEDDAHDNKDHHDHGVFAMDME